MSTDSWKLEKDLCRCCHSEGSFQNLGASSFYDGQEEIYSDMLRESLDINLNPVDGLLSDVTYTICEMCIARLRDASNFKQQVLRCEENFKDMIKRDFIKIVHPLVQVKPEIIDDEFKDDYIVVNDNFQMLPSDGESDDFKDEADVEMTIELEDKPKKLKGKGKAKPKEPKTKKPAKKTGRPKKIKEDTTDGADSADKTETDSEEKSKKEYFPGAEHTKNFREIEEENGKKYLCNFCGNISPTVTAIKDHIVNSHPLKTLKCYLCSEEFVRSEKRFEHIIQKHTTDEGEHSAKIMPLLKKCICGICKKKFAKYRYLQDHIYLQHLVLKCPECLNFFKGQEMQLHRNEVHGVYMPTCGVCGYKHRKETTIIVHQKRVHMKEKHVKCSYCDLSFFDRLGLHKHMICHKPEKKFECSFCHKKFQRKTTLRLHEKIHTGEKNKVCSICGERFVQKASLNYHMVKRHPETS